MKQLTFAERLPVWLVTGVVLFNGVFALLETMLVRFPHRFVIFLPVDYELVSRNLALFAGFTLIYMSSRLAARKRLAWIITLNASLLVFFGQLIHARSLPLILISGLTMALLLGYRNLFNVASEPVSITQGLRLLAMSLAITIGYGSFGFYILLKRDFGVDFNVLQSVVRTLREVTLIGNDDIVAHTREARFFLHSLDAIGIVSITVGLLSLFRPLTYRFRIVPAELARARSIVDKYGRDSEDEFKLWPEDKTYFFARDNEAVIAYRVAAGVAVVLGDPVGSAVVKSDLISQFRDYAHKHGWSVAFLYIPSVSKPMYERLDFKSFMIGQDAVIPVEAFTTSTIRNKHFRAVRNKRDRLGISFEAVRPPHSVQLLHETAEVTHKWLSLPGRSEHAFGLGYHDRGYVARSELFLLRDSAGTLLAFMNGVRSHDINRCSVDLIRHLPAAETGVMDMLILSYLEHIQRQDGKVITSFNFGLAPLGGTGQSADRDLAERIVGRLSRLNVGSFSFTGLRRFKQKFNPIWEDRYLMYERGAGGLSRAAIAITQITRRPGVDK